MDGGARLEFRGAIPRGCERCDGVTYSVALVGDPLSAVAVACDIQPQRWTAFFRELAQNCRGWPGVKTEESLEGEVLVACTSDQFGIITLRVQLRGERAGAFWRADDSVFLLAGQLDAIARAAEEYFG